MHVQLETERLQLAPLTVNDHPFILALLNSPGWLQFIGPRGVTDAVTAEAYIRKILSSSRHFYSVIRLRETGVPIGIITFIYRLTQSFPDVGYALLPAYERKGYAAEAVAAYLQALHEAGTITTVLAITLPDNARSIHLLEKLGFGFRQFFTEDGQELRLFEKSFALGGGDG
jgi:ribosomal-protein-alanine N-acetyltransferase